MWRGRTDEAVAAAALQRVAQEGVHRLVRRRLARCGHGCFQAAITGSAGRPSGRRSAKRASPRVAQPRAPSAPPRDAAAATRGARPQRACRSLGQLPAGRARAPARRASASAPPSPQFPTSQPPPWRLERQPLWQPRPYDVRLPTASSPALRARFARGASARVPGGPASPGARRLRRSARQGQDEARRPRPASPPRRRQGRQGGAGGGRERSALARAQGGGLRRDPGQRSGAGCAGCRDAMPRGRLPPHARRAELPVPPGAAARRPPRWRAVGARAGGARDAQWRDGHSDAKGAHRRRGRASRPPNPSCHASTHALSAAQDLAQPAGLANLGATCYVNAVLQCLFANPAFRAGIYAAEPAVLAASTPLRELRCVAARRRAQPLLRAPPRQNRVCCLRPAHAPRAAQHALRQAAGRRAAERRPRRLRQKPEPRQRRAAGALALRVAVACRVRPAGLTPRHLAHRRTGRSS